MKKMFIFMLTLISLFGFSGCSLFSASNDVVRIHIRANSNDICDQEIKLQVRDKVVNYITPLLSKCENSQEVKYTLETNLRDIENVADRVLCSNGYSYVSSAKICNEYFPSRDYDGVTFPADYYDALIINLGSGKGDNWWCVAYPPLCFVGEDVGSSEIKYKSKLVELINKFFGE